uniref:BESS domain-containing protein n=1 Tax=Schizaphis graminum TaxID=13262 RepID=A0A2S2PTQ5_SCHGA
MRAGLRPGYKRMKGLEIQKKCKSLQDDYLVKALRKIENVKSGSAASVKSLSLLFKRLQLNVHENLTENPETQNLKRSFKTSDHTDKYLNYQPPKKKIKLHHFLNHLPLHRKHFGNISKKNLKNISLNISEKKEKDKDQLFCLSLYKEMKKLPKALRLKTKIEIYNLISQKQTTTNTSSKSYKIASV